MCLALPGRILEVLDTGTPLERRARVSFGGIVKEISLAYVPEARVDQYVIVHVGFALSVVDEEEAKRTIEAFADAGLVELGDVELGDDGGRVEVDGGAS